MKKTLVIMLAILLIAALTLAGCSTPAPAASSGAQESTAPASADSAKPADAQADGGKEKVVAVSVMFSHPYFDTISNGIEEVMGPEGYKVVSQAGENNVEKQIQDIEDWCAQGVDAIFVEPFDWQAIKPGLEAANKAGIPIMCVDAPCYDADLVLTNVQSNNYGGGELCAQDAIKKTGGKGNIVILDCPTAKTALDRADGFAETIAKEAPDMKVIAQQNSDMAQDKALEAMENILQANKDIQVVFAVNEEAAIGAITAIESAGLTAGEDGILVYSINGASMECKLIKDGKLIGTAAQQPLELGKIGGQLMLDYINNGTEPKEKQMYVDVIWVDKNTVDSYTPVY